MFIIIMLSYFDNHENNIYEDLYHIEHLDNFSHARVSYPSKWMVSFISENQMRINDFHYCSNENVFITKS